MKNIVNSFILNEAANPAPSYFFYLEVNVPIRTCWKYNGNTDFRQYDKDYIYDKLNHVAYALSDYNKRNNTDTTLNNKKDCAILFRKGNKFTLISPIIQTSKKVKIRFIYEDRQVQLDHIKKLFFGLKFQRNSLEDYIKQSNIGAFQLNQNSNTPSFNANSFINQVCHFNLPANNNAIDSVTTDDNNYYIININDGDDKSIIKFDSTLSVDQTGSIMTRTSRAIVDQSMKHPWAATIAGATIAGAGVATISPLLVRRQIESAVKDGSIKRVTSELKNISTNSTLKDTAGNVIETTTNGASTVSGDIAPAEAAKEAVQTSGLLNGISFDTYKEWCNQFMKENPRLAPIINVTLNYPKTSLIVSTVLVSLGLFWAAKKFKAFLAKKRQEKIANDTTNSNDNQYQLDTNNNTSGEEKVTV